MFTIRTFVNYFGLLFVNIKANITIIIIMYFDYYSMMHFIPDMIIFGL